MFTDVAVTLTVGDADHSLAYVTKQQFTIPGLAQIYRLKDEN